MPKLKVTVSLPSLDRERYLRDFKVAIDQAVIKAARKFLLAAVPHIPVFTGFARGALGNLEDIVGRVQGGRIRGTLQGVKKEVFKQGKRWYYYPPGKSRVVRSNVSGRPFATPKDKILPSGQLSRATTSTRITFKFAVDITYFNFLDENKWGAFAAGRQAFDVELKDQLKKLIPKIGKYYIRRGK